MMEVLKEVKMGEYILKIPFKSLEGVESCPVEEILAAQRTPEWFAARANRRTASQSPTIMGVGYGSLLELYFSKIGDQDSIRQLKDQDDSFVERIRDFGTMCEPHAAELYLKYKKLKKRDLCPRTFVRGDYLASFDLASADLKQIVEIKCPYHGRASQTWKMAEKGQIDPKYIPQLEHQLLVAGAGAALDFMVFDYESCDGIILQYQSNRELRKEIHEKWDEFYINFVVPRKCPERDVLDSSPEVIRNALRIAELKSKIAELEKELKPLEEEVKQYAADQGHKKILIAGTPVSISREVRNSFDEEKFKKAVGEEVYKTYTSCKSKKKTYYTLRVGKKNYDFPF